MAIVVTQFPTANEGDATAVGPWTNPDNAHADDAIDATVSQGPIGETEYGNLWKNFGFDSALPADASIEAVKIILESGQTAGGDMGARAVIDGVFQAAHPFLGPDTYPVVHTIDVSADRAWTRTDLLNAHFKVSVHSGGGAFDTAQMDYVKVEVTYVSVPPYERGRF